MTVTVFLLSFAAGLGCGTIDGILSPVRKSAGIVFTVITDVVLAFCVVGLHTLVLYFHTDGQVFFYAVAAQLLGFFLSRAAVGALLRKVAKRIVKKPRKKAQKTQTPEPIN